MRQPSQTPPGHDVVVLPPMKIASSAEASSRGPRHGGLHLAHGLAAESVDRRFGRELLRRQRPGARACVRRRSSALRGSSGQHVREVLVAHEAHHAVERTDGGTPFQAFAVPGGRRLSCFVGAVPRVAERQRRGLAQYLLKRPRSDVLPQRGAHPRGRPGAKW